jgi:hypothetical protein
MAGQVLGRHELSAPVGTILHDWRGIWMTPALLASGVLVVFLIFFRERKAAATDIAPIAVEPAEGPP